LRKVRQSRWRFHDLPQALCKPASLRSRCQQDGRAAALRKVPLATCTTNIHGLLPRRRTPPRSLILIEDIDAFFVAREKQHARVQISF